MDSSGVVLNFTAPIGLISRPPAGFEAFAQGELAVTGGAEEIRAPGEHRTGPVPVRTAVVWRDGLYPQQLLISNP